MIKYFYTFVIAFYSISLLTSCTFAGIEIYKDQRDKMEIKNDVRDIFNYPNLAHE